MAEMIIHRGTSFEDPIKLFIPQSSTSTIFGAETSLAYDYSHHISNELNVLFGKNDGDYFIVNQFQRTVKDKKYHIVIVEDSDGDMHTVIFLQVS